MIEKYLNHITENKLRKALTQFRTSSHNLMIETGRHQNIDINQRICQNCNTGMVENEYHFLLICPKYNHIRTKYIKRYYYTWPTTQKFTNLLNCNSTKTIKNLAKYIYYSNTLRQTN